MLHRQSRKSTKIQFCSLEQEQLPHLAEASKVSAFNGLANTYQEASRVTLLTAQSGIALHLAQVGERFLRPDALASDWRIIRCPTLKLFRFSCSTFHSTTFEISPTLVFSLSLAALSNGVTKGIIRAKCLPALCPEGQWTSKQDSVQPTQWPKNLCQ